MAQGGAEFTSTKKENMHNRNLHISANRLCSPNERRRQERTDLFVSNYDDAHKVSAKLGMRMYGGKKVVIRLNLLQTHTHKPLGCSFCMIGSSMAAIKLDRDHVAFLRLQQGIFLEEAAHSVD